MAQLTILSNPVAPGQSLVFTFSGFQASQAVQISVVGGGALTAMANADGAGTYSFVDNDAPGVYQLEARNARGDYATVSFTVGQEAPEQGGMITLYQGDAEKLKTAGVNNYIPAGAKVDIQLKQTLAQTIFLGNAGLAFQSLGLQLEQYGLAIDSRDGANLTFHCTATRDVYISEIDASGANIAEAGGPSLVLKFAIMGALLALGITFSVMQIKISSDQAKIVSTKAATATDLAAQGYTAEQIAQILGATNPPTDSFTSSLGQVKVIVIIALIGMIAYMLISKMPAFGGSK